MWRSAWPTSSKAFDYLKENGFKIIDKAPRKGSRGTTVFFVHPKTTETAAFGYLIEVVQEGGACLTIRRLGPERRF